MEFGYMIRGQYPANEDMQKTFAEVCEQIRLADQLGYTYILKGQHYSTTPLQALQLIPFLSRIMVEAPNAKLVTGIVLLPLHKPIDVAEQLASIDVMSGGRLVFGSGIGYRDVEFKAFGTEAKDRGKRFEECLEAIIRLWTEDTVTMKGSHFALDNASCSVMPIQKPMPPLWIGANVDAAVRRCARMADTWFINPHQRMDTIERQLGVYREALEEESKPDPDVLPLMRECFVAETTEKAVELARPYLEAKYKAYHAWGQDKSMPEGDNDLDLPLEELADGRFLLGSPEMVAEQIIDYNKRLGVNVIILGIDWVGMPHRQVCNSLRLFAEKVMPLVKNAT